MVRPVLDFDETPDHAHTSEVYLRRWLALLSPAGFTRVEGEALRKQSVI